MSLKWRIYRREGEARSLAPALLPLIGEPRAAGAAPQVRAQPRLSQAATIGQQLILDRFAPASVLVNSNYEALYFCGPTDDFLVRPRGAPTQDLLAMVRDGLRSRLRAALREAALSETVVNVTDARMKRDNAFQPVQITVTPSPGGDLGRLFMVVFRQAFEHPLLPDAKSAEGTLIRQLETSCAPPATICGAQSSDSKCPTAN